MLLKDIEWCSRFRLCFFSSTEDRLRQRPTVHLLVLVQWNGIDLHRDCRHHVGRFLIHDEAVHGLDVNLFVRHDVGGNELSAGGIVKGLHGSILDAGVLAYDGFHLFQLDTETTDLHLTILAAYELDVTIFTVAHNVARTIDTLPVPLHEGCSRSLRLVQVTLSHLRTGNNQLAGSSPRQLFPETVHDKEFYGIVRFTDGDIGLILIHIMAAYVAGGFRRSVGVEQSVGRRIQAHQLLTARS